ncbi:MAG: glycosyltransferase family 2 protein [Candidatus Diapherotrites archaeon]
MKLVVTIPAYNEEKTIAKVISEIPKRISGIKEIEVIVIDDGSTDRTKEMALSLGAKVYSNKKNFGLAYSFSKGLNLALESGADIIVNTDADFQYDQKQMISLVKPIIDGEADVVLGSRFLGKIEYMPLQNFVGNIIVSQLVSFLTGTKITDSQTGFRAFSKEAAMKIKVYSDYTYTQETIMEAIEKKLVVKEVPVNFRKREGKSRLISNIFDYGKKVGLTIIETYINYRPLRTFSLIGFFLIFFGLISGSKVMIHFINTGEVSPYIPSAILSSLLLIMGFQAIVLGMVAEIMKRNRKIQEEILYLAKKNKYSEK